MTTHNLPAVAGSREPLWAIVILVAAYAVALLSGWPQQWTASVIASHAAHAEAEEADGDAHATAADPAHGTAGAPPPAWMVTPFVLLLLAIAAFPLTPRVSHWWESNFHRFLISGGLGLLTLAYYAFAHKSAIDVHWPAHAVVAPESGAVQTGIVTGVLANAILAEFVPFIVLLFSLYTIAGGIRIEGDLRADSLTNAGFMAAGGLLASFVGTTGAAMLLVRPLLETNQQRKHVAHTVVFFIFIVCNCGGCLLPIGDPPLFLGYLEGVAFTWTLSLWREWLLVNGLLLIIYCVIDKAIYFRHESIKDVVRDIERIHPLRFSGLQLNGPLLLGVVLAVALLDPSKAIPGTDWHPWMFLREIVLLSLVAASLWLGSPRTREQNNFNYAAIIEVAALFVGIFVCMQPALQLLHEHGGRLGVNTPQRFFWATGSLSSVLDNAPTYVVFLEAGKTIPPAEGNAVVQLPGGAIDERFLIAVSLGAVMMGAMTYIGNGPNFMVKAIAEQSGVRMPSFFGYMLYSFGVLLPILALMTWLFL